MYIIIVKVLHFPALKDHAGLSAPPYGPILFLLLFTYTVQLQK